MVKKAQLRYFSFLLDFCYRYCPTNNKRFCHMHKYKRISSKIKYLHFYIFDFCPYFLLKFYSDLGVKSIMSILIEEYEKWKKRGDKF